MNKRRDRWKKPLIIFMCVLLCAVSILSGTVCMYKILNETETERYYREADDIVISAGRKTEGGTDLSQTVYRNINSDNAGWLIIPCLDLSYPVMFSGDNEYYQHRDSRGKYAFQGSLYIDMYSSPEFSSANTVIYGHNMLNGTMFGRLWHIVYRNAAEEDPYFWIITEDGTYRYMIFSAFETTKYSEGFKQFDPGTEEFLNWCSRMKECSYINTQYHFFQPEDRVVTLATCGSSEYYRTLVMGVRIGDNY